MWRLATAAGVSLGLVALGPAAAADAPARRELPPALSNSPIPLRGVAFKPSTGLYAGRAPAGPYWPHNALDLGAQGYAVIDCRVRDDLRLNECHVITEKPQMFNFGEAAVRMADDGWMTAAPLETGATPSANGWYRFPVLFPRPRR